MISNLQLLQYAHHHLSDPRIDACFKNHLLSIVSRQEGTNNDSNSTFRKTEKVDAFATVLFPQNKLTYFDRLMIRNRKLCTFSSAGSKSGDDSAVVFRLRNNLCMGRIRSIFTVMETDINFLLIDYPTSFNNLTCQIDNNNYFRYSYIQTSSKRDSSTCLVQCFDVVEKCVFFERPNGDRYFMRFPTLQHCS